MGRRKARRVEEGGRPKEEEEVNMTKQVCLQQGHCHLERIREDDLTLQKDWLNWYYVLTKELVTLKIIIADPNGTW